MIILKLLQVIREDEEQRKTAVGQQMTVTCSCRSNSSDYKDCGVTGFFWPSRAFIEKKRS